MTASIPLVITMGVVTTLVAYIFLRRDMKRGLAGIYATNDTNEDVEQVTVENAL